MSVVTDQKEAELDIWEKSSILFRRWPRFKTIYTLDEGMLLVEVKDNYWLEVIAVRKTDRGIQVATSPARKAYRCQL